MEEEEAVAPPERGRRPGGSDRESRGRAHVTCAANRAGSDADLKISCRFCGGKEASSPSFEFVSLLRVCLWIFAPLATISRPRRSERV